MIILSLITNRDGVRKIKQIFELSKF